MIPKVEFKISSIEHMINPINRFLNPKKGDWNWSLDILNKYPELNIKLSKIKDISKREKVTKEFYQDFLMNNKEKLEEEKQLFQEEWDTINDKFMKTLSGILDINWPRKDEKIIAYVSLNPICPRYIKKRTFDIYHKGDIGWMKSVAMHEILHFLWFEKWKQIFPKTSERHFDGPHLEWQLSEMVPKIILSDEKIQKIFKHKPGVYREYLATKIDRRPLLSYIGKFYHEKKDFEDFVRKSWSFVQKYKKEINKI